MMQGFQQWQPHSYVINLVQGAETALVIHPAHSNSFFDLYVREMRQTLRASKVMKGLSTTVIVLKTQWAM